MNLLFLMIDLFVIPLISFSKNKQRDLSPTLNCFDRNTIVSFHGSYKNNKHLMTGPKGKAEGDIEGRGETKLTVSRGASH